MGSGIALAALYQALPVILYDISGSVLEKAEAYIRQYLAKKGLQAYQARLHLTDSLEDLGEAGFVIEAIPEDLKLKQDLLTRLDRICPPPAILATNTSTLSISAIASGLSTPERLVGLHFFNPAPVMPLVEVIRGSETSTVTVDEAIAVAERLGKTPVLAADSPGFIVNRVARPYYGEALRLAGEGTASLELIDQVVSAGAGFRMGPFQLMDLIGLDINLAAMQSMFEQTFGEPRYRPHPLQARLVAQNRLGVKSGQGFYRYKDGHRNPTLLKKPELSQRQGLVRISPGTWGPGVAGLFKSGGYSLLFQDMPPASQARYSTSYPIAGLVLAGRDEGLLDWAMKLDQVLSPTTPLICQTADSTVTEIATHLRHPDRLVGIDGLFVAGGAAATLIPGPGLADSIKSRVTDVVQGLGRIPVWIEDSPALILPRIIGMLVNEAAFAVLENVASPETVDRAMRLGVNYPRGPIEWGREIGLQRVVAILDHLRREYGEERYRACNLLRRWARNAEIPSLRGNV